MNRSSVMAETEDQYVVCMQECMFAETKAGLCDTMMRRITEKFVTILAVKVACRPGVRYSKNNSTRYHIYRTFLRGRVGLGGVVWVFWTLTLQKV